MVGDRGSAGEISQHLEIRGCGNENTMRSSQRRDLRENALALMASLGETTQQIATSLQRSGVRATPRNPSDCAIAVFLGAVLASDSRVGSVYVTGSKVMLSPAKSWQRLVTIRLSAPLGDFISSFDLGTFPELTRTAVVVSSDTAASCHPIVVCLAGEGS